MYRKLISQYAWLISAILVFFFSWNAQSLWIDECCMMMSAAQETFGGVWTKATDIGGSDTQMAFYLYLLHIWTKLIAADTELIFRTFNIIWVLLTAWFLRKEPKVMLIVLISPFFIYYANELRPYIMQIAAACAATMFLYKRSLGEKQSYVYGFGLLFLLCTTSLSSVVWCIGFLAAWIILDGKHFWSKNMLKALSCWSIPFIALGSYYLYTLLTGARATHIKSNFIVNIAASVYELFGLTGLGPARGELRTCTQIEHILQERELLLPAFAGVIIGIILIWGAYKWYKQASRALPLALLVLLILPLGIFSYASGMMDFRFSGRHLAPVFPVVCIMISLGVKWSRQNVVLSILSTILVCLWVTSAIRIRFDNTYAREDYRGAVAYCQAKKASGEQVLLLCDHFGKHYYGWQNSIAPEDWSQCQVIAVSRPENYKTLITEIEDSHLYQKRKLCPAFWVYERISPANECL